MNKLDKKTKYINIIALLLLFLCSSYLIYKFSMAQFSSDYPAHIKEAIRGEGYSFVSLIMAVCCGFFNSKLLLAFAMATVILLNVFTCAFFIKKILKLMNVNFDSKYLLLLSISTLFICKICVPEWSDYFYKYSLSTQSWHNSTFTFMRMISLVSLVVYFQILENYKEKISYKKCIVFTLVLFITNYAKPSFVLAFSPVMLYVLIRDFIKTKTSSFKNAFIFGVCVLISCSILLFQYKKSFGITDDGNNTIAFSVMNLINYFVENKKFPLYFVLAFAYPIYISYLAIKNRKKLDLYSKTIFIQVWAMYIVSFFEKLLLVEVGPRAADGNFGWGSQLFSYILFITCICMQMKMKKENIVSDSKLAIANYTYALHIIYGIFYFALLLMGYSYYF